MNRQIMARRAESTGAALTLDVDLGEYPSSILEIWVKSSAGATFEIFGSIDGEAGKWRKSREVVLAGAGESAVGLFNGFRYVRVSTAAVQNNEIEIAAGG